MCNSLQTLGCRASCFTGCLALEGARLHVTLPTLRSDMQHHKTQIRANAMKAGDVPVSHAFCGGMYHDHGRENGFWLQLTHLLEQLSAWKPK